MSVKQVCAEYGTRFGTCFINLEGGVEPEIADGVVVNGLVDCQGKVVIEKDVFTGHDIMILTGQHDYTKFGQERKLTSFQSPVTIKEGAWLASRCMILPGVTVGKHAIVGAGSIVTHDVPDYCLVAGNPAKIIKRLHCEKCGIWLEPNTGEEVLHG